MNIYIDHIDNYSVLRDDKLEGGTKSILLSHIDKDDKKELIYASPVYGGFQIAISQYCKKKNKKAVIFTPKRKIHHTNTKKIIDLGASVFEIPYGRKNVIEKWARDYYNLNKKDKLKISFGGQENELINIIKERALKVIDLVQPNEIWVSVGSGTIISGILRATNNKNINVVGVKVGGKINILSDNKNYNILEYPKNFSYESKFKCPFPSTPNYDLKAFEMMIKTIGNKKGVLFWNVL